MIPPYTSTCYDQMYTESCDTLSLVTGLLELLVTYTVIVYYYLSRI